MSEIVHYAAEALRARELAENRRSDALYCIGMNNDMASRANREAAEIAVALAAAHDKIVNMLIEQQGLLHDMCQNMGDAWRAGYRAGKKDAKKEAKK